MRINVEIGKVVDLAARLGEFNSGELAQIGMKVVNKVADETYDLARPRMLKSINLTDAYVQSRMRVDHATSPNKVEASVIAIGEGTTTQLARYDSKQLVTAAKRPRRAKGDALRSIAPGMKQAGISVEVNRGSVKPIAGGFFMPLKNGNGMGLFTRTGAGKKDYKLRYGPSVYQLFRVTAGKMLSEVADDLETALITEVEASLARILQ